MIAETLRKLTTPPVFPGDEHTTRRAQALDTTLLVTMALTLVLIAGNLAGGKLPLAVSGIDFAVFGACLLLRRWVWQGRIGLAGGGLLAVGFVAITAAIALMGTTRAPSTAVYMLLVVAAGLIFGLRGMIVMTALSALALAGLIGAEAAGRLPQPDFRVGITQWITYLVMSIWAGSLTLSALQSMRRALARAETGIAEHRQTVEALRESEERYRLLVETSPDGIGMTDLDGRLLLANRQVAAIFGYGAPSEMMGANLFEMFAPEEHDRVLANLETILQSRAPFEAEYIMLRRDGTRFYGAISAAVQYDAHGAPVGLIGIIRDITERKRAEAELQRSEMQYRSLAENSPDLIARFDRQGRHLYINAAAAAAGRVSREAYIGKTIAEVGVPEPEAQKWHARIQSVFETGQAVGVEDSFDTPQGRQYFDTKFVPEFDPDGSIHSVQSIARDTTDHKRAAAALVAERTLLRTLVDHLPDAVYVKDLAGRKTLANPADVRSMRVASEAAALGKTDFEVYPADMAAAFAADDQRVVSTGQPILNREERITHGDGSQGWELTSKMPLRDPAGQVIGLVGIGHDITELKQAEFQREAALAALAEREAQYRGLFENASIAIFRSRPEGQSLQVNPAFARLFGYDSPEQVVALVPDAAAVFADPAQRVALIAHLQAGNNSLRSTHLYRRRDGTLFTGHLNVRAERDATGAIRYLEGFIEDITDRERAAAETATRARQQAAIAELGQLALTGAGLTTLLDQTVQRLAEVLDVDLCKVLELQRERGALLLRAGVGWHAGLVGQATVGIGLDSQAGFTLQSKQPVIVADLPTETRFHGPALLVEHGVISGVSTIIGAPERPYGVLGVHTTRRRDFSQQDVHFVQSVANLLADAIARARAEETLHATLTDLQRSNADLEQFAYVASHDLQEPLRMVTSYVQLLAMRYEGQLDADADEFIGYAAEGAKRMQQLILDLLEYSRVGTRGAAFWPTDATAVCQAAIQDLEVAITEHNATVVCDPLPTVLADPSQLRQLFQNLIGNAIKFHGAEPPVVHVSACLMDDARSTMDDVRSAHIEHRTSNIVHQTSGWVFSVRDNGIGIEPQYFERIFVIFQRLHACARVSRHGDRAGGVQEDRGAARRPDLGRVGAGAGHDILFHAARRRSATFFVRIRR